jgi:lysophospholipase L1-like esterase
MPGGVPRFQLVQNDMSKVLPILALVCSLLPVCALAQSQSIVLNAPAPPAVTAVTAKASASGLGHYCEWVIAIYPIGKSIPSSPACVSNAGGAVTVSWSPAGAGVTGYDVLRTVGPSLPTDAALLAMATNVACCSQSDNLGALASYTLAATVPAQANIRLDNQSNAQPRLYVDTPLSLPASLAGEVTNGLLAWYDFRPGANSNTLYDRSGNRLDGLRGATSSVTATDFTWLSPGGRFAGNQSANLYSSGLNAGFNGAEGSFQITFRVASAADWADGVARDLAIFLVDANNQIEIGKSQDFGAGLPNRLSFLHLAGGIFGGTNWMEIDDVSATGFITLTCTWSKTNNRMRAYLNGSLVREAAGLGVWGGGNLNQSSALLGAHSTTATTATNAWDGDILDALIYTRELTPTEVATNYRLVSGYTQKLPSAGRTIGFIGDSILQAPAVQGAQTTDVMPFPYHASMLLNSPSLNKGVSGDTTTQMVARFATDITANLPYAVLIEGGTNDASVTTPIGTVTANYTAMINAATAAGIKTLALLITPATVKDNTQMALIDTYNAAIQALGTSNGSINCNPAVGQFRPGGTAGNLWDWQPAFVSGDGLHPNEAGARALAKCVAAGFVAAGLTQLQ